MSSLTILDQYEALCRRARSAIRLGCTPISDDELAAANNAMEARMLARIAELEQAIKDRQALTVEGVEVANG